MHMVTMHAGFPSSSQIYLSKRRLQAELCVVNLAFISLDYKKYCTLMCVNNNQSFMQICAHSIKQSIRPELTILLDCWKSPNLLPAEKLIKPEYSFHAEEMKSLLSFVTCRDIVVASVALTALGAPPVLVPDVVADGHVTIDLFITLMLCCATL